MIILSLSQRFSRRSVWISWFLLCIAVCLVHLITLEISPLINQDEVQIVDYGRVVLNPSSDWAITWYVQEDSPILPFSYLGKVIQEVAFRATDPSGLGPRFLSMIAAVIAATFALGWLMARNTPPIISLILALAFLVDPIFSEVYRGGRVDGWAIAACLGSCWLLRAALIHGERGNSIKVKTFVAGALLATSLFLWLSAAILVPLVLLECYYLVRLLKQSQLNESVNIWAKAIFYFGLGGLVTLVVLFIPLAWDLKAYLLSAEAIFELQRLGAAIQHSIIDLFLLHDPFFFVTTLVAIAVRREIGVLIAFAFALLLVYQTMIYLPRVLYFLPYFMAMIGYSCSNLLDKEVSQYKKYSLQSLLVLLIGWNAIQVLMINPAVANAQRPANESHQFTPALTEAIGPGPYRVLLKEYQAYYAGRALGWDMYSASNPVSNKEYTKFLSTMDYIILSKDQRSRATFGKLEAAGFELKSTIRFASPEKTEIGWGPIKLSVPQKVYPPIKIFQKKL